jgi:hypothetical protein
MAINNAQSPVPSIGMRQALHRISDASVSAAAPGKPTQAAIARALRSLIVGRLPDEDVMNVVGVGENVRDERAKSETDHVPVGAPILDEERDLPPALEIKRAPQ